jgi:hypothetical protein
VSPPSLGMLNRDQAALAERATAILRDEIANGALANIAAANRVWSANRPDLFTTEAARRLAAELGSLLDPVLDLLAPAPPSVRTAWPPPPAAAPDHVAARGRQTVEPLPVLRPRSAVLPGGAAEIHTALRNDGPTPVDIGFVWSDLVAEPDGRIPAERLRLLSGPIRIPPGAVVDLAIGLDVPNDVRPGLYQALLQATECSGLCALLRFPVGLDG